MVRTSPLAGCIAKMRFKAIAPGIAAAHAVLAGGGALVPLKTLTQKADAIVVADVRDAALLRLAVVRVLKGPVRAREVLTVSALDATNRPQSSRPPEHERGLFFLRRGRDRSWSLMPPNSGYLLDVYSTFIPLPRAGAPEFPPTVVPVVLDRVIAEAAGSPSHAFVVEWEYRQNRTAALSALFARFRARGDLRLRVAGLIAGIYDEDERVLADLPRQLAALSPALAEYVQRELGQSMLATNVRAVGPLCALAMSAASGRELRLAAANALARVHTRPTLHALAAMLDSPDVSVRTRAVAGLSMFANNTAIDDYRPLPGEWRYRTAETMASFITDERRIGADPWIVSFWKAWWHAHCDEFSQIRCLPKRDPASTLLTVG